MPIIYIVEDELRNLKTVEYIIHSFYPDSIVKSATGLQSAIDLFTVSSPDLVLLDIEYPDGNAFDLLKQLPKIDFNVIFITAHEKYALEAIKFSAIDYILKPFTEEELVRAIRKGLVKSSNHQQTSRMVDALITNYREPGQMNRPIVLKTFDDIFIIKTSNVVHCSADNNYTTFFLEDKRKIMVSRPIKEYEELLGPYNFMRVHQIHLVNLIHIHKFDKRDGGMLVMDNNQQVPVATRRKQLLMDFFNSLDR
jgi:two-component system, LytTR family, response regulator